MLFLYPTSPDESTSCQRQHRHISKWAQGGPWVQTYSTLQRQLAALYLARKVTWTDQSIWANYSLPFCSCHRGPSAKHPAPAHRYTHYHPVKRQHEKAETIIYTSIIYKHLSFRRSWGPLANPSWHWANNGAHLNRSHVHQWANAERQTTTHALIFTFNSNLELPINLTGMSLVCRSTWRRPTKTQGRKEGWKKGRRTCKLLQERLGLNLEPSCCEAKVLTTAPLCPQVWIKLKTYSV